jgi:hypothetical protein
VGDGDALFYLLLLDTCSDGAAVGGEGGAGGCGFLFVFRNEAAVRISMSSNVIRYPTARLGRRIHVMAERN